MKEKGKIKILSKFSVKYCTVSFFFLLKLIYILVTIYQQQRCLQLFLELFFLLQHLKHKMNNLFVCNSNIFKSILYKLMVSPNFYFVFWERLYNVCFVVNCYKRCAHCARHPFGIWGKIATFFFV